MLCPQCNNAVHIDHVSPETGKYAYVCLDPKCPTYRKAQYLTGEETETQIKAEK